jgi:hypothetical protein
MLTGEHRQTFQTSGCSTPRETYAEAVRSIIVEKASVLAQRTGMARLNGYLYRINVAESDQCARGQARETVEHLLFRCQRWTVHWTETLQCTRTHRGNISLILGGKSPLNDQNWKPNVEAVRAAVRFANATGRLDAA